MIKNVDTIIFQFDKFKKTYNFEIPIDSKILDIEFAFGFITIYCLNAITSSIVNREYYIYNCDDKFDDSDLKFIKTINIETLKYFIFERIL